MKIRLLFFHNETISFNNSLILHSMAVTGNDINKAAELLKNGEVIAIPTETVYGLAANALDPLAVLKIYEVKQRPRYNPLIIHIADIEKLKQYTVNIPDIAVKLAEKFWPGPLTMLLPKSNIIPDEVTSGLPDVAVRVPDHKTTLELLRLIDFPLAAPSANPFGYISPTSGRHVEKQIGSKIPYILDGGECSKGVESTIIGFEGETPVLYRLGAIPAEAIEAVCGSLKIQNQSTDKPKASGMLPYHYAPHTPLIVSKDIQTTLEEYEGKKTGIISWSLKEKLSGVEKHIRLSESGNEEEAARNLYAALHEMDALHLDLIIAEWFEDRGLGKTLNDRLMKASNRA
jgi:L-threonylcarbamoyladenylate synthase